MTGRTAVTADGKLLREEDPPHPLLVPSAEQTARLPSLSQTLKLRSRLEICEIFSLAGRADCRLLLLYLQMQRAVSG